VVYFHLRGFLVVLRVCIIYEENQSMEYLTNIYSPELQLQNRAKVSLFKFKAQSKFPA
jgi:hypothetical protein